MKDNKSVKLSWNKIGISLNLLIYCPTNNNPKAKQHQHPNEKSKSIFRLCITFPSQESSVTSNIVHVNLCIMNTKKKLKKNWRKRVPKTPQGNKIFLKFNYLDFQLIFIENLLENLMTKNQNIRSILNTKLIV